MRVLVGCECSGRVRDAFIKAGHDAWSCDLQPSKNGGAHIVADVRLVVRDGWDLFICHPPCTFFTQSSVWALHRDKERWKKLREAEELFLFCLSAPIPRRALENPVPHGYAAIPRYDQKIQPYFFGDGFQKATCLWLRGLPKLQHFAQDDLFNKKTHVEGRVQEVLNMPPSVDRGQKRSVTYPGIAQAMADQWGGLPVVSKSHSFI